MKEESTAAWRIISAAAAAIAPDIDLALRAEADMPLNWYDVLRELGSSTMSMNELATASTLSRTRISRLVDELVHAGLVVRNSAEGDRRRSLVSLSEQGASRLQATKPMADDIVDRAVRRHLPAELITALALDST